MDDEQLHKPTVLDFDEGAVSYFDICPLLAPPTA